MKEETKQSVRDLAYYSSLGLSIGLAIFIGLFGGILLDRHFGTHPILMFVGLALGIVAGFRNIFHAMARVNRNEAKQKKKDGNENKPS